MRGAKARWSTEMASNSNIFRVAALVFMALTWLSGRPMVSAQDTDGASDVSPSAEASDRDAAGDRSTSFQAVSGARVEDVPGGPLLIAAYGAILSLLVVFLWRQQRAIEGARRRVAELEARLGAAGSAGSSGREGEAGPE